VGIVEAAHERTLDAHECRIRHRGIEDGGAGARVHRVPGEPVAQRRHRLERRVREKEQERRRVLTVDHRESSDLADPRAIQRRDEGVADEGVERALLRAWQ